MIEYLVTVCIIGVTYLVYFIKKKLFDDDSSLESWAKSLPWFPSSEDEILENHYMPMSSYKVGSDRLIFCGGDIHRNLISLALEQVNCNARVKACVWLQDGRKLETFGETEELLPCSTDWTTRDFTFQVMEPFESWRIVINTIMKSKDTYLHVNMRFMWRASSTPIYLHEASSKQLYYSVEKTNDLVCGTDQYGILSGTVSIDGETMNVHYLSVKHRSWHSTREVYVKSDYEQILLVNLSQGSCAGHYHKCNKSFDVLSDSAMRLTPESVQISIRMPDKSHKQYTVNTESSKDSINMTRDGQFCFNFKSLFNNDVTRLKPVSPLSSLSIAASSGRLVIPLTDNEAMNSSIVGGKAANLAILKRMISEQKNHMKILIPSGVCITVEAYRRHLANNKTITNVISQLDSAHDDDLELKCKKLQSLWLTSRISPELQGSLSYHLTLDGVYAVRSSGIEEDLGSSSAAGQNESVLGVTGEKKIGESIVMCWASLFSYQSVQYRRKNGLKVSTSEMCVLIQELVPEVSSAGVLFSCDPVTGHPWTSVISCNYGLGLSVVAASCDPDTFTLTRDVASEYKVKHKKCGNKGNKTVFQDHLIQDLLLSKEENALFCIQDEQAIRIAQIGNELRTMFGYEADIEWVLDKSGSLYILQVRPVTSILNWTDNELIHEFDSPIHEGYDALTFHNIGESCPGFISPLTLSTMRLDDRAFDRIMRPAADVNVEFRDTGIYSYHGALQLFHSVILMEDDPITQVIICGQVISTPEIHRLFRIRSGHFPARVQFKLALKTLVNAIRSDSVAKKSVSMSQNLSVPLSDNPIELLNNIVQALATLQIVMYNHCIISGVSSIMQRILVNIISGNEVNAHSVESLVQVANSIINSTNTVSVDIPRQFENIVSSILNEDPQHKFVSIHSSDGMKWLSEHCARSHQLLEEFFDKFGHRGNKEMDFLCETWSMNKPKVLDIIRTLIEAKISSKSTNNAAGNRVKQDGGTENQTGRIQQVFKNSKIANLLLPFSRSAVARREITKEALVLCFHKIRLPILYLGSVMQRAGLLTHSQLVFYLTLYELKQVTEGRNRGVISKALRRERLCSQLDKLIFPPQSIGRPSPVNRQPKVLSLGKQLSGTPVWPGEVLGVVRVLLSLSEANTICQGDILVTHATDTGWTPYFTMLGGLVTELGGILSHGAVVAREYGLPCIVGVDDVTLYFKTGDKVLLNSTKGTIEKIVEEKQA
uniref:Uncharacterized phosphotransferase YvkC n=2 Tax=Cacopsylla melanoneura TaxID=428564 RepID=A0A8D8LRR3_9HEMI